MTGSVFCGLVEWALILWFVAYCIRHNLRARASTVSGNRPPVSKTGPRWEQDKPYPECFDEYREDDL